MKRPVAALAALVVSGALGTVATLPATHGHAQLNGTKLAAASTSLTAAFVDTDDWGTGYVGEYVITNKGTSTVTSWDLSFNLPAGAQLVSSWDGDASVTGAQVSVTNASWDGALAAGASTDFGFQVAYSSGTGQPTSCLVDGTSCQGAAPSPTTTSVGTTTSTVTPATTTTTRPATTTTTTTRPPTTTSTTTTSTSTTTTTGPAGPSTTTTVKSSGTGLTATYSEVSSWYGGYSANYTIVNNGPGTSQGWALVFNLPPGGSLANSWNGVATVSGTLVTVANESYNGTLTPGATAVFGFQVTLPGPYQAPTSCTIDGANCQTGAAPPTTTTTLATTTTAAGTPPPPSAPGPTQFAPYIDMTLQQQDLASISQQSGISTFTLAFVVSDGTCTPSWGGVVPVGSSSDYVKAAIGALQKDGGNVIISFGGEAGTELAQSCSSVASLEAAYQEVVDTYGVYDIDFDIEGAAVSDTASVDMRWAAVAQLQHDEALKGHTVTVSVTLPVLPSGFPSAEMSVLSAALSAGVNVSVVNPMTMDYGDAVTDPSQMGTYAIEAAQSVQQQLSALYPDGTAAQLWAMVGITPLIGQNDVSNEVFTLADAQQVAQFAAQEGVGRLSMWSVTRDQQCSQGVVDYDDPSCSGVLQGQWAFSHTFEAG